MTAETVRDSTPPPEDAALSRTYVLVLVVEVVVILGLYWLGRVFS